VLRQSQRRRRAIRQPCDQALDGRVEIVAHLFRPLMKIGLLWGSARVLPNERLLRHPFGHLNENAAYFRAVCRQIAALEVVSHARNGGVVGLLASARRTFVVSQ
jgi:hypothetical protein